MSQLEDWLRGRSLQLGGAVDSLEPLIQAAQLLQVSKRSESDARAIEETCTALSPPQVSECLYQGVAAQITAASRGIFTVVHKALFQYIAGSFREIVCNLKHKFRNTKTLRKTASQSVCR